MPTAKKVAFSLAIFLVCWGGASVDATSRSSIPPRGDYAKVAEALEPFIVHELQDKHLPALSIALADGTEVVWARGFGYADPTHKVPARADTIYRIGSVSKLFTDIGVMQMAERGLIDIDAPVSNYIPSFTPANQFSKAITLRQLMSHRSGLQREPPIGSYFDSANPSIETTVRSLSDRPLIYEPETRVKYSNGGVTIVGYVLEFVNKEPFATYIKQAVLMPMGLQSSAFEPDDQIKKKLAKAYIWTYDGRVFAAPTFDPGIIPAGSMYSSVLDLGQFLCVLFNGGNGPTGRVIKAETLDRMWESQFQQREPRNFGIGFVLGDLDGHRTVGHSGAVYGFATELKALPDDRLGAVATTTMDSANAVTSHIVQQALRLMLAEKAGKPLPKIQLTQPISAGLISKAVGRYGEGDSAVNLFKRNGELYFSRAAGGNELRLRMLDDEFIVDDKLAFGTKITLQDNALKIGEEVLQRSSPPRPTEIPNDWKNLIGEYGWDYNVLKIFEHEGRLESLIEWYEYEPLTRVSKDVFVYPKRGLYDNEEFVFTRDGNGRATQVAVSGVVFKRRSTKTKSER